MKLLEVPMNIDELKSVATAIGGPLVGWGKLERKATVEVQP